jgi:hypothetical protein
MNYAPPTEAVTTPATCQHDRLVGLPNLGGPRECHECDWCPACEAVRRYDGESCTTCRRTWGAEQ